jgi:hypothetical protein
MKITIVPYDNKGQEGNPIEIEMGQCEISKLNQTFDQSSHVDWNGVNRFVKGKTLTIDLTAKSR